MARPIASVQVYLEDGHVAKGPNDPVKGTVILNLKKPALINNVTITFVSTATWTVSPFNTWENFPIRQQLFSKTVTLVSNDARKPGQLLSAGRHNYEYHFTMPNESWLPPSFACMRTARKDKFSCIYIFYQLHAAANLQGDMSKQEVRDECNVFYWPTRLTELRDGHMPIDVERPIALPKSLINEKPKGGAKLLFSKLSGPKLEPAKLVISMPRYSIIDQTTPISLRIEYGPNRPAIAPVPQVGSVKYSLVAVTRIGQKGSHYRAEVHDTIQTNIRVTTNATFNPNGHIALDKIAPFVPKAQPGWDVDGHSNIMGPLCPTFEYSLAARSYRLDLTLHIECDGNRQLLAIRGPELVLLPPRLDASVKPLPPEMPGVVPAEADWQAQQHEMGVPMPELGTGPATVELEAMHGRSEI